MINQIIKGIVVGAVIPVALLGIIYAVFHFSEVRITGQVIGSTLLLGLGLNAIYIRVLFKKDKDYASRGVMISSFVYFFVWIYLYVI